MAKREMPRKKTEVTDEIIEEAVSTEEVEVDEASVPIVGIVSACAKLNVREEPDVDSSIVCEIAANSKVMIDEDKSTEDWFSVCTETGFEGYCMKRYITITK